MTVIKVAMRIGAPKIRQADHLQDSLSHPLLTMEPQAKLHVHLTTCSNSVHTAESLIDRVALNVYLQHTFRNQAALTWEFSQVGMEHNSDWLALAYSAYIYYFNTLTPIKIVK
jgi:hypothetical protein